MTDAATNLKTYYPGNAVEYTESNNSGILTWVKSYVYLGDSLLSTTTSNGAGGETIEYSHPDALGTRIVSNAQTGTTSENINLPFGTQIQNESTNTTNKRKFTSYDRSAVTGLDYAQNRTYDPKQGRFTQVDPIGIGASSLMNPQSLNLYAYCGNDPINHTDPTGLFWGKLFRGIGKAFSVFNKVLKWVAIGVAVAAVVIAVVASPGAAAAFLLKAAGIIGKVMGVSSHSSLIITNFSVVIKTSVTIGLSGQLIAGAYTVGAIASSFAQTDDKQPKKKKNGEGESFCYTPKGDKVVFKSANSLPIEAKNVIIEAAIREGVISGSNFPNAIDNYPISKLYWIANMESSGIIGVKSADPSSTARGLFQLNKPNYGLNPHGEDSFGNGVEEAQGGIRYIRERYGNAAKAVEFWKKHCWY